MFKAQGTAREAIVAWIFKSLDEEELCTRGAEDIVVPDHLCCGLSPPRNCADAVTVSKALATKQHSSSVT